MASEHHEVLAHHFENLEQQRDACSLGMWVFLVTEVMIFGAIFAAYAVYRYKFPHAFAECSLLLDIKLGAINTAVLIGSSLSMAMAVHAAAINNRKLLTFMLVLTIVLGIAFLGIKSVEYHHDYEIGVIPGLQFDENASWLAEKGVDPGHAKMFFVLYFCLTGLHAIHMIIGMVILAIMAILAWRRYYEHHDMPVEIMGLYWHFVDIVWIFLFPLLYLVGMRH